MKKKIKKALPIILILGLVFLLRFPSLLEPLTYDEELSAFLGRQIISEGGFYSTLWYLKPPLAPLTYTLLHLLFGYSPLAIRFSGLVVSVFSILALYLLTKFLFGKKAGFFSALIFAIFSSSHSVQGDQAIAELYMIFFTIAGFYLFFVSQKKKRRLVLTLSGLTLGAGFLYKQVIAFDAFCLFLFVFLVDFLKRRGKLKALLQKESLLFLTFLTPLLLTVGSFYLTGKLSSFIEWAFLKNLPHITTPRLEGSAWISFKVNFSGIFKKTYFLWLLPLVSIIYSFFKHSEKRSFLILWSFFAALGVVLSGYFFPHHFLQITPPFSILGGLLIADFLSFQKKRARVLSNYLVLGLFSLGLLSALIGEYPYFRNVYLYWQQGLSRKDYIKLFRPSDRYEAAEFLKENLKEGEEIYLWDTDPVIYVQTGKRSLSKYIYTYPLLNEEFVFFTLRNYFSNFERNRKELMEILQRERPTYIIIYAEPGRIFDEMLVFGELGGFTQANYSFFKKFGNVLIFKLKREGRPSGQEALLAPLDIVKRYAAITEVTAENEQTEITFEPMVNPEGILRSFKAVYPGTIEINFEPITLEFFGKDGYDSVGFGSYQPSGVIDLHLRVRGVKKPISFVRVKIGKTTWNNRAYGVNPVLKIMQTEAGVLDLFFEPPKGWQEKTCNVYFIYKDGTISSQDITLPGS